MFGRKRIKQLEAQLADKDRKIYRLEDLLARNEKKFELVQSMLGSKPEDCRMGEYCKACAFSKAYLVFNHRRDDFDTMYLCNKAGSCQNYVQKEKQ